MDSESLLWNENIPIDLINDILLRLPAKAIGRCMLANKRWYSLVKSTPFIKSHLNKSKMNDHRLLIVQEGRYTMFSESDANLIVEGSGRIPFPVTERDLCILGSCRGLVLVRLRVGHGWLVLLWNPLLEKFKVIDRIIYDRLCVFALGFHEATNDYRVVRIARASQSYFSEKAVDVYSFTKDGWHRVDGTLADGSVLPIVAFPERMGTYVHGVVHWLANHDRVDLNHYIILTFDFDNELFKMLELPNRYTYIEEPELKELNGKLALSCFNVGFWESSIFTWVMKNYPHVESWTNIGCLFELEGNLELWPVVCTKQENCIYRPVGYVEMDMLSYYNAKEDKIYDLEVVAPYVCPVITDFVESLALLDVENQVLDGHIP